MELLMELRTVDLKALCFDSGKEMELMLDLWMM